LGVNKFKIALYSPVATTLTEAHLPVGGGNLGALLSRHSGDNLTKRSCHRSARQIAATVR